VANADCAWDEFDPEWYVGHNYRVMRDDDREILRRVRDFFADVTGGRRDLRGIDVGSGANLYPSLAMLPFCDEITLWERSHANVRWLEREVRDYASSWDVFWDLLCEQDCYRRVEDPRAKLAAAARVRQGNVFDLDRLESAGDGPALEQRWDIGTMFFVAESITALRTEFARAVTLFIRALRPGAPFAAAFMRNSTGYDVNKRHFPAVAVTEAEVKDQLSDLGCHADVAVIPSVAPLREGYDGMILARGRTGEVRS
jgi:NNMT/PNMT/TEMT family.